jgi:hypothetical protein
VSAIGTAFDAAQNLYISNAGVVNTAFCAATSSPNGAPTVTPMVTGPYSSATTAYRKIAVNATQLYAANVADTPGWIDVYNLPITVSSTPSLIFKVSTGAFAIFGIAVGK